MKRPLKSVMLIDDNIDDNFFHEREIVKDNPEHKVIAMTSGPEALDYLRTRSNPHSDLIFLDINMPGMNGWEFLTAYQQMPDELKKQAIVIMLTTSDNTSDMEKAKAFSSVTDYITKPLTRAKIKKIEEAYFS